METLVVIGIALVLGAIFVFFGLKNLVEMIPVVWKWGQKRVRGEAPKRVMSIAVVAFVVVMIVLPHAAYAQTATPVPTITIPTGQIFTETNNWIGIFSPIASMGIGATIALAILGYLGRIFKSAFSG